MDANALIAALARICAVMDKEKDELVRLDAQTGDGDLGISMSAGFRAAHEAVQAEEGEDLGRLMLAGAKAFNEAAPSSLGTILSIGMMAMAKALRGQTQADAAQMAAALQAGVDRIMEKAGSKPGEKTILDALVPGVKALGAHAAEGEGAWQAAAQAAAEGSESTRGMRPVHGRAAYYGDKAVGMLDGGSVVGMLIFKAIAEKG